MLTDFDKAKISDIVAGHGDWFTARLLRLIAHADLTNLGKLRQVYPEEVEAIETWRKGST